MTMPIIRRDLAAHIAGRITTTGRPLRRWSVCQLCGLDSGPWLTLQAARISGLMHLASHHPDQTNQSTQDPILTPLADAPDGVKWCPICVGRYLQRAGKLGAAMKRVQP